MASFISIPAKKTSEVDLVKPLKSVISQYLSAKDDPNDFKEALEQLNKLRASCTSKSVDHKSETTLEQLERYYDQLSSLEQKCPGTDLHVSFKWKDAFEKGGGIFFASSSLTIQSLGYEKTCILFNIAACHSQIAAVQVSEGLNNDLALKSAAKSFQLAAGIFQALKHLAGSTVASTGQDLPVDLHAEILTILSQLMLAQAQECFFYKAVNDGMKDAIIAKIANQCEELYADVLKSMQVVKYVWPEKEWVSIVGMKQATFHGIAEYHQAQIEKQNKEFGSQIARLRLAAKCLKGGEERGGFLFHTLFKDYLSKTNQALAEAEKDNDFIYHARIPDEKSLPQIGRALLAKATPLPERFRPQSADLFAKLLPVPVQQAVQKLDSRKQEIVNQEIATLRELNQVLNATLASLNLPAALEDEGGVEIPPSVLEKAAAIKEKGGAAFIQTLIRNLPDSLQRNREILSEIERSLKEEEETDERLRNQFGAKWTRKPSRELNGSWKEIITKYRNIMENAMEADNKVRQKFETHRAKIELLSTASENELKKAIPASSSASGNFTDSPVVKELRSLMGQVDALKAEREVIESELKNATFNDMKSRFLDALAKDGAINEFALSTEAIGEILGPLQKQIRDSKERQEQIIAQIQRLNPEFVRLKGSQSASEREAFLKDLASAHNSFQELVAHLEEGTKFYNDLTQLLVNLQSKVNDFCFARKAERDELCKDLQNEIVSRPTPPAPEAPSYHSSTTSASAPPRPPPPAVSQPGAPPAAAAAPYSNPYANPYPQQPPQPYYYAPPPLPPTYNPYAAYQQPAYPPPPQQPTGYPYPQQPQAPYTGYPYPQQPQQ